MTTKLSENEKEFFQRTLELVRDKIDLIDDDGGLDFSLPAPKKIYEYLDSYVIGQNQAKKIMSVVAHNHYKRLLIYRNSNYEKRLDKTNMMIVGPTGSGKTYLVKRLAEMLNVPCYVADANSLTSSGYVGKDVESIIEGLLDNCDGNYDAAATGIVFIDEFDKICKKETSGTKKDVGGEAVQQGLLKIIEGTTVDIERSNGLSKVKVSIDTNNILFIVGGAFVGLEKVIAERMDVNTSGLGFNSEVKEEQEEDLLKLIHNVTAEDLEKFGFIPEVLGRIPLIATLDELTVDDLVSILKDVKNNLVEQYQELFSFDGNELSFTDEALREMATAAKARKVGARGLKTLMEEVLLDHMFDLESAEVTKESVVKCLSTDQ